MHGILQLWPVGRTSKEFVLGRVTRVEYRVENRVGLPVLILLGRARMGGKVKKGGRNAFNKTWQDTKKWV